MAELRQTSAHEATANFLLDTLTGREREIAAYITRGTPNKIIAAELGISQRTIEAHRARIFMKMRVRNAVQLTQRCLGGRLAAAASGTGVADPRPVAPEAPIAINEPGRLGRVSTPVRRWDQCPPGASAVIPAAAPARSGGSVSARSTG